MRRLLIPIFLILQLIAPELVHAEGPERPAQKIAAQKITAEKPSRQSACISSTWHYEPVEGKLIGIWPPDGTCSEESYRTFRKKYGFTGAAIRQISYSQNSPYQRAIDAGLETKNIMIITWESTYIDAVKELPAGYYYLDEPVEHDCSGHSTNGSPLYSPQQLSDRRDYVHSLRPDSKFVIGGYKRCSHLILAAGGADDIMYTSYVNWNSMWLPICHVNMGFGDDMEAPWVQGSGNQSDSWGDMRSKFGAKFSMSWMHGNGDEYLDLFQTANALGLEGIWLYAREGMGTDSAATLEKFCQAAAAKGWLKMVDDYIPAPDSLKARRAEDGHSVRLDWKDMSDNEKGFVIERKLSASDTFTPLTTVGPGSLTFIDSSVEEGKVYSYRIKAFNDYSSSGYSNEASASSITSTGGKKEMIPPGYGLFQNHPNPYNPSTKISYTLPTESRVRLLIYDAIGGIVKVLSDQVEDAGYHEISFNAAGFPSGIYFYSMEASAISGSASYYSARKMLLLK